MALGLGWRIEQIEGFCSEFEPDLFPDGEGFKQREVKRLGARSVDCVAFLVAQQTSPLELELGYIEPLVDALVEAR